MNKLFTQVFKKAGVNAKVSKDPSRPRFKVIENKLTLEGYVKGNTYTMKIKDVHGKEIDTISVPCKNTNDIVNRINESIGTLKMLSREYDNKKLVEDAEEFDDVVVSDEDAPEDLASGLDSLYDSIVDVASQAEALFDVADETDAEQMTQILSFSSALYDCAIDVADYSDELTEPDDVDESFSRKVKKSGSPVSDTVAHLTMCEAALRGRKEYSDILRAIKDIKSELTVRG